MTPPENPSENPAPETSEATFSLKRAAEVAGVSPSTLRRNKDLLRQHGATITESGWKVPMSALIASGLMRRTTPPDAPTPNSPKAVDAPVHDDVHARLLELERENLELRHRAELEAERRRSAEAVAHERGEALEAERMALRMLTAGSSAPRQTTDGEPEISAPLPPREPRREAEEPVEERPAPRRPWWGRMFG